MLFELTILGTSAAVPAYGRFCSAQLLRLENTSILIDCGEGTQMQLQQIGEGHGKIDLILISHLHGDHYFGLPGLLTSMILNGRTATLRIISPPGLRQQLSGLIDFDRFKPPFEIIFEEIVTTEFQLIHEGRDFSVHGFPLVHRLPTNGFLIREKPRLPNFRKEAIAEFTIPYQAIPAIKAGGDFTQNDGTIIPNEQLVNPALPPRSYAFCSDTRYFAQLAEFVKGVDLLYHEATFLHVDLDNAERTLHSTALEAGQTARDAQVGQLVIGHFSARYPNVTPLETEARSVFSRAYAARELMRFVVPFVARD